MVQIRYHNADATSSFIGNIDIANPITTATTGFTSLELVTGGAGTVTQSGGSITATSLGVIAGGDVTLTNPGNSVGTLAGFTDGIDTAFSFTNAAALTVGTMPAFQLGVAVDATTGQVSSFAMTGAPSNPLAGLTTTGLTSVSAGALTIASNIAAPGQTVTLTSTGPISENADAIIIAGALTGSSVGGATLTSDNLVDFIAPWSNTDELFSFTNAQPLTTTGTISSTGGIALTTTGPDADLTLAGILSAPGSNVTLVSDGAITQTPSVIAATLGITSVGPVSMLDANQVGTLAASVTGVGNGFAFRNDGTDLMIGTVGGLSGITTNNGEVLIQATTSGNVAVNQPINAGTAVVALQTDGSNITQIAGPSGKITAGGLLLLESPAAPTATINLTGDNAVDNIAATINGGSLFFNNTSHDLAVDTVTSGLLGVTSFGISTSNGQVALRTASSGNIAINQPIDAGTAVVGLQPAGNLTEVTGPAGKITASGLELAVFAGSATLPGDNAVDNLAATVQGPLTFNNT